MQTKKQTNKQTKKQKKNEHSRQIFSCMINHIFKYIRKYLNLFMLMFSLNISFLVLIMLINISALSDPIMNFFTKNDMKNIWRQRQLWYEDNEIFLNIFFFRFRMNEFKHEKEKLFWKSLDEMNNLKNKHYILLTPLTL